MSRKAITLIAGLILGFALALLIVPVAAQVNPDDFKEMRERNARLATQEAMEQVARELEAMRMLQQQTFPPATTKPGPTAVDMEVHGSYVGVLWSDGRIVRQRWADTPIPPVDTAGGSR